MATGSGANEIVTINKDEFPVDERDGNGLGHGHCGSKPGKRN
jgi:hypothetical protein